MLLNSLSSALNLTNMVFLSGRGPLREGKSERNSELTHVGAGRVMARRVVTMYLARHANERSSAIWKAQVAHRHTYTHTHTCGRSQCMCEAPL